MPELIKYAEERAMIHRVLLDHYRTLSHICLNSSSVFSFTRDLNLYSAIFIGQCDGRPMSLTKLSEYSGMPKATALRRIAAMQKDNLVIREGNLYYINPDVANKPEVIRAYSKFKRHLLEAHEFVSQIHIPDE